MPIGPPLGSCNVLTNLSRGFTGAQHFTTATALGPRIPSRSNFFRNTRNAPDKIAFTTRPALIGVTAVGRVLRVKVAQRVNEVLVTAE